jgi:WD40-like Beta Propeller Repeat
MVEARSVRSRSMVLTLLASAACLAAMFVPAPAHAQYFGQNKVNYQTFSWRTMHTEHYNIYFYPAESLAVADAARMAERWYVRHSLAMRDTFTKKPIVLYADDPAFQQNNIAGYLPEEVGGVTEPSRSRALLYFSGSYWDANHVIGHELTHVFQFDIAGAQRGGLSAVERLPQWSIEGMAEYMSLGRYDPNTTMFLRDAALRNDLPRIKKLNSPKYFAYRYGEALWAFIGGTYGDSVIPTIYRASLRSGLEGAVRSVLGITTDSLSKLWIASIKTQLLADAKTRTLPDNLGTQPFGKLSLNTFDLAPEISPDGSKVALIRFRGLPFQDLLVADATTGKVLHHLTSPNSNPHFDVLSWTNASGSWSPDGQRIAVPAFANGRVEIEIFNVNNGSDERHITVPGVDQVLAIAWSPDGRQLAVAGMSGGWSDLYLYDLQTKQAIQLEHDRDAHLQPAWSPDGHMLAFVTDSGPGTSFDLLQFRPMQIAVMDMTKPDHPSRLLTLFGGRAKNINPQFTPDGQSLYFVSDPDGIPDIYRTNLTTGAITRITRVATAITGLTYESPALSVAQKTGRLIFDVFRGPGQSYSLHVLEPDQATGAGVNQVVDTSSTQGFQPPAVQDAVTARIDDPRLGLPVQRQFAVTTYHPTFQLDGIATAGAGVAFGGPFGTGAGGGVAFQFGDELEDHILAATVEASGQIQDVGGEAVYINQTHRWNYGVAISHLPFLQLEEGNFDTTLVSSNGTRNTGDLLEEEYLYTYYESANVFADYPLSMTRRFELAGGFTYLHYGLRADEYLETNSGGVYLLGQQVPLPVPPGFSMFQTSAAYVTDYSTFGFTSPIAGGASRFEVDPTFGQLNFVSVTADYRRYLFANPITFAIRLMHYGRYGYSAEDPRLSPIYLGNPYLIRGYDLTTFNASECPALYTGVGSCPLLSRLLGSRIAVFNAELRIPVLGYQQFGLINFPYLPTEIAPFFDGGLAWSSTSNVQLTWNPNASGDIPVFSAGVSARVNILGYVVASFFAAKPFQRPGAGVQYGFLLLPGW